MIMNDVRYHSADDMMGVGEFENTMEPVAVVIRPDGSADAYGYVAVMDQRSESRHVVAGDEPHGIALLPPVIGYVNHGYRVFACVPDRPLTADGTAERYYVVAAEAVEDRAQRYVSWRMEVRPGGELVFSSGGYADAPGECVADMIRRAGF
jgi:hypothetical protein